MKNTISPDEGIEQMVKGCEVRACNPKVQIRKNTCWSGFQEKWVGVGMVTWIILPGSRSREALPWGVKHS
jgi:hypothetical protein